MFEIGIEKTGEITAYWEKREKEKSGNKNDKIDKKLYDWCTVLF